MTEVEYPIPEGCIERFAQESWCGRHIYSDEFSFKDVEHAAKHYADSNVLKACPECIRRAKLSGAIGVNKNDLSPMATRGIDRNDR